MTPTLIFHSNSKLLEGPIFDEENNLLYFVSILDGLVYCFNPTTKEILSIRLDSPVSCVYFVKNKVVLVASKNGFFEVNFNTLKTRYAFQISIADEVRYNDGIQDPKGRIIIGTMGFPEVKQGIGNVYSYHSGKYKTLIYNTTISNGLAFSRNYEFLYFIDTPTRKVAKYTYDLETGDVAFKSYVIEFKDKGVPDGMCIDENGMLWIAEWGGASVSKWNPITGKKIDTIKLPCANVTSCCFDNDSNLYITTAKDDSESDIYGGGLYHVELDKS